MTRPALRRRARTGLQEQGGRPSASSDLVRVINAWGCHLIWWCILPEGSIVTDCVGCIGRGRAALNVGPRGLRPRRMGGGLIPCLASNGHAEPRDVTEKVSYKSREQSRRGSSSFHDCASSQKRDVGMEDGAFLYLYVDVSCKPVKLELVIRSLLILFQLGTTFWDCESGARRICRRRSGRDSGRAQRTQLETGMPSSTSVRHLPSLSSPLLSKVPHPLPRQPMASWEPATIFARLPSPFSRKYGAVRRPVHGSASRSLDE